MATRARTSTPIQMVVAMLVILVPALVLVAFFTRNPEPPVTPVEYRALAERAAATASYPVLVPQNLPEGWVAVRARWTPVGQPGLGGDPVPGDTWQLGMLSPERTYVGLDQRDVAVEPFVADATRKGRLDGTAEVAGRAWQRYVSEDGRTRSLVLRADGVAVVSGDLPYGALEAFASTLAPVR